MAASSNGGMPPLTRGGLLIDQLVQATVKSCQQPCSRPRLSDMAQARKTLERHMASLEKQCERYVTVMKNSGGRPQSKGWSTHKTQREGRTVWRATTHVDGNWRAVGIYKTRTEASQAARDAVAKIRAGRQD